MESSGSAVRKEEDDLGRRERESWERRPFARTFDLISSEYGWTDDQILDLTMQRINQTRSVIWERRKQERARDLEVREIELRTLATHISAGAGHKEGLKAAEKISLQPVEIDEKTGQPKRDVKMIPFSDAKRWFGA